MLFKIHLQNDHVSSENPCEGHLKKPFSRILIWVYCKNHNIMHKYFLKSSKLWLELPLHHTGHLNIHNDIFKKCEADAEVAYPQSRVPKNA